MKNNKIYYLLTITVIISLLIPTLIQDGMFVDGVTYSAISKNMANGIGNFWKPHYSKILYSNFYEHPPLVFAIQSLFFKLFGNAFYTERIYCIIIVMITIIGISKSWRLFFDQKESKHYDWLPVLLWITIPTVFWSLKNNMLENTMTVFTIFAVFFILRSLIEEKLIFLFAGAIFVILASLSKGLVGIFPLAVPVIFALVYKKKKIPLSYFVYLILSVTIIAYLLSIAFPGLKENINHYFNQQLIPALNNKREITTQNRFSILINLIIEISIPILILVFIIIKQWTKDRTISIFKNKTALLFFLIALSASIPLIISLKQRKFYLVPSIPFYVLSISFWIYPLFKIFIEKLNNHILIWIKRISIIVLLGVFIFSIIQFGKFSRDQDMLHDVYAISKTIPEGTVLSTSRNLWTNWGLAAYMSRIGYLSLDSNHEHEYYLTEKNNLKIKSLENYDVVDLKLNKYKLLKRKH